MKLKEIYKCLICSAVLSGLFVVSCGSDLDNETDDFQDSGQGDDSDSQEGDDSDSDQEHDTSDSDDDTPLLPPCVKACDRIVECAVDVCDGIGWQTSGVAFSACKDDCSEEFAEQVLTATGCADQLELAKEQSSDFVRLCDASICDIACEHLSGCLVEECPNFDTDDVDGLFEDCASDCDDENAGEMLSGSCDDILIMAEYDPFFEALCMGDTDCPGSDLCVRYAGKMGGCFIEHCNGNADPFLEGLTELFIGYCMDTNKEDEEECPPISVVEYIVDDSVTCDSPTLENVGTEEPFDEMCDGTLGVEYDELKEACETLSNCGFDLGSIDLCTILLSLSEEPPTIVTCIATSQNCTLAAVCLEDL
ncbi:MAG: hypothetical protein GY847_14810 [Proteobacteria bacterium]|nr:hypothetical protein [Pseudomonadota bacterium]